MSDPVSSDPTGDVVANPIQVLLVDDDRPWAKLLAEDIERAAEEIDVTIAASAGEGMERLAETAGLDCVVADYRMPGKSGIEMLEEVRTDHPRLPFVLVTSEGSETVAARAMDAGVTDYLIKDIGGDQVSQFVSTIRTAVEHHRLQRAIEESEQRYRTVTEQSRDAIAIVREGELLFFNQRLVELAGPERDLRTGMDAVETLVHPADRAAVESVIDRWGAGGAQQRLHEARIVRADGTVRDCEYTGCHVEYGGTPAALVSIRDVTERNRRERELQWERELTRTIQEALVDSRTRERLERTVTEQLQNHGYALAWIGEQAGDVLAPRSVGGDRRYLEEIDRTLPGRDADSEPSVVAARTNESQFLGESESPSSTGWGETARKFRYRSCAALPLVYNDVPYGVLAVYHEQPDRFDETERRLLADLADTVAFAIHSLETQGALATDDTVAVTVHVDGGYYLIDLDEAGVFADCDPVEVVGTVQLDDARTVQYVEVGGDAGEALLDDINEHPVVQEVKQLSAGDASRLQVTVTGAVPEARLAARGIVVNRTVFRANAAVIEFELPTREDVRAAVEPLDETFGSVSVRSVKEHEPGRQGSGPTETIARLTAKQRKAVKAAYYQGYFEQPRRSSATEVAETLDVSHSTFLRHLRPALRKTFETQFEPGADA